MRVVSLQYTWWPVLIELLSLRSFIQIAHHMDSGLSLNFGERVLAHEHLGRLLLLKAMFIEDGVEFIPEHGEVVQMRVCHLVSRFVLLAT